MRAICVATSVSCLGFSSTVLAGDFALLGGTSDSSRSKYHYLGLIVPVGHDSLDASGFVVRLWTAYKDFDYSTTFPGGPAGIQTSVTAKGPEIEGAVGYQHFFEKESSVSAYIGFVNHHLTTSPFDSVSGIDSKHSGLKAQLEGRTREGNFGVSGIGSYVSGLKDYWMRARPAYYFDGSLNIGPELILLGGQNYTRQQLGLFVDGIKVSKDLSLGFALGADHDSRPGLNHGTKTYGSAAFVARF